MTVQLPTSFELLGSPEESHRPRQLSPVISSRGAAQRSQPRARRRTRTHPLLTPCLSYADTVRRGGNTQQTLRKKKVVDPSRFSFCRPLKDLLLLSVVVTCTLPWPRR